MAKRVPAGKRKEEARGRSLASLRLACAAWELGQAGQEGHLRASRRAWKRRIRGSRNVGLGLHVTNLSCAHLPHLGQRGAGHTEKLKLGKLKAETRGQRSEVRGGS